MCKVQLEHNRESWPCCHNRDQQSTTRLHGTPWHSYSHPSYCGATPEHNSWGKKSSIAAAMPSTTHVSEKASRHLTDFIYIWSRPLDKSVWNTCFISPHISKKQEKVRTHCSHSGRHQASVLSTAVDQCCKNVTTGLIPGAHSLWTVGLAAFRRASGNQEQHDLLNATHNIPPDWGWECINCRVATYSTTSAIAITSSISQVNTQHSWGHTASQTVSLLGRVRRTKLSVCPRNFAQILISRLDADVGYFYALFTITKCCGWDCSQILRSLWARLKNRSW